MDERVTETPRCENMYSFDMLLLVVPLVLSIFGIIMIISASGYFSLKFFGSPWTYGIKQIKWLLISLVGMAITYSIPTKLWRSCSGLLWIIAIALTFATIIPFWACR